MQINTNSPSRTSQTTLLRYLLLIIVVQTCNSEFQSILSSDMHLLELLDMRLDRIDDLNAKPPKIKFQPKIGKSLRNNRTIWKNRSKRTKSEKSIPIRWAPKKSARKSSQKGKRSHKNNKSNRTHKQNQTFPEKKSNKTKIKKTTKSHKVQSRRQKSKANDSQSTRFVKSHRVISSKPKSKKNSRSQKNISTKTKTKRTFKKRGSPTIKRNFKKKAAPTRVYPKSSRAIQTQNYTNKPDYGLKKTKKENEKRYFKAYKSMVTWQDTKNEKVFYSLMYFPENFILRKSQLKETGSNEVLEMQNQKNENFAGAGKKKTKTLAPELE